jgi:hypothetical protein
MKVDFDKLTRFNILGTGAYGTAYLVTINGNKYVLKVQKILPEQVKKNTEYAI